MSVETVSSGAYTFTPSKPGIYTLTVSVVNGSGKVAPDKSVTVTVAPFVCYVSPEGGNVYPYDTPSKAATDFGSAIATVYGASGRPGTVYVAAGEYVNQPEMTAGNGYTYVAALEKPMRLVASDGPAHTRVRYASADLGGCFYLGHAEALVSGFTLSGSTRADNDVRWSGYGNAVSLMSGTVSNCVMTGCSVTGTHVIPTMLVAGGLATDCAVIDNNLGSCWGRGALGAVVSGGTLANSVIARNSQTAANYDLLQAGGVYMSGGCVTGCRIEGNFAARKQVSEGPCSGGVVMTGGNIEHTLITGNTDLSVNSATLSGGGLVLNSAAAVADHVTVAGNVCSNGVRGRVGGAYVKAGTLRNSIVWGNDALDLSGAATYTCAPEATSGEGNLTADPKFRRKAYAIGNRSPCAHAGLDATYMGYAAPVPDGLIMLFR